MRFDHNTGMFCGNSCATSFDTGASWGLGLSFNTPFKEEKEDPRFKIDTVETSKGKIYLKMRVTPYKGGYYSGEDHYGQDTPRSGHTGPYPEEIEHYTCNEVIHFSNYCHAPVGMCLLIDSGSYYIPLIEREKAFLKANPENRYHAADLRYYEGYLKASNDQKEKLEKVLAENNLLYKSVPFYNLVHSERDYPSCTLYIYDKGMKNEV